MSETFQKILVTQDSIASITDQVKYAVMKGGQNYTAQPHRAISESATCQVYNIAVPSLETVISREVLWESTVTLRIEGTNKPANEFLINYGVTDALAPFPLHQLASTMTCTINNNTVATITQDVLAAMLRLCDPEELAHYNDLTPTTLDFLGNYCDGVDRMPYQLQRWQNPGGGLDTVRLAVMDTGAVGAVPNGETRGTAPQSFMSYNDNVLSYDNNRIAGSSKQHRPRGSYRILETWVDDGGRRLPRVGDNVVFVKFKVIEPILMSPFTFGTTEGKQGFYGIQTLNFQMNMQSTANRAWRSACFGNYTKSARIERFEESTLRFHLLTPHASQMLTSRNVVPYYELPVYKTINLPQFVGRGDGEMQANGTFNIPPTTTVQSSNIQLNGIPDKLVIFIRKTQPNLTCDETDRYLTVESCRISFNNQAGLLSSMSPEQLYTNSVLSGLQNMTFDEFRGLTVSVSGRGNGESASLQPFSGLGSRMVAANGIPGFKYVSTVGSLLVLNFAEVIQLTDEYYAPGSLGTFNLQLELQVRNNHADNWPAGSAELIIIPINSGVFVNERGTSSTFLSLLTKQDVLSSLGQPGYTKHEVGRMVGGSSFGDRLHSAMRWIGQKAHQLAPMAKSALAMSGNPYAQAAAAGLQTLGYGHKSLENRTA